MTLTGRLLLLAVLLLVPALLVTSALADLRSPTGTEQLGATLAADPAVQDLVVAGIVDAVAEDVRSRGPALAALVPALRPAVERAVAAAVASPAGEAALASALTDALRQLTTPGPLVIDLRAAAGAAAAELPPPLDELVAVALAQGDLGVIVLGDDAAGTGAGAGSRPDVAPEDVTGTVAGVPSSLAVAGVALLLAGALVALVVAVPPAGRRASLIGAGARLLVVGAPSAFVLSRAPDLALGRLADVPELSDPQLVAVVEVLVGGLTDLLSPTATVALAVAVVGGLLLAAGIAAGVLAARAAGGAADAAAGGAADAAVDAEADGAAAPRSTDDGG